MVNISLLENQHAPFLWLDIENSILVPIKPGGTALDIVSSKIYLECDIGMASVGKFQWAIAMGTEEITFAVFQKAKPFVESGHENKISWVCRKRIKHTQHTPMFRLLGQTH